MFNTMIVAIWASHDGGNATTWTAPGGVHVEANLNDDTTRSGLGVDKPYAGQGVTQGLTATASTSQAYALVQTLALRQ